MLVPALVAILLGELGGRLASPEHRKPPHLLLVIALIAVAAAGGGVFADRMSPWARTLLVGLALLFAGGAQLRAAGTHTREGLAALAIDGWASSVPLTVFALAAYAGAPLSTALGAALGLVAAAAASRAPRLRAIRKASGAVLLAAGLVLALSGLRLL